MCVWKREHDSEEGREKVSDPNVTLMSAPLECGEVEEREGEGETMMNTASVSSMSLTDLITALSPLSPVMHIV